MADNDYDLKIGADGSAATAEFNKLAGTAESASAKIQQTMREASYNMASAVKESSDKMQSEFAKISGAIGKMQGAMAAFAAIAAGGAAFKASVDGSVNMTKEAVALGKALGITASEASVLNVALNDVYLSSDTMLTANQKLAKTLGTNEEAFTNLGVATRDANGNFRSSLDIMLDTNKHLMSFKEGIDRNIEGQKIYGKSWGEVSGVLRLTSEKMEESRQKANELSLVVGQENVEATAKYRAAMNDVGDVLDATKKTIGDALLPVLTEMGNWFADIGPAVVTVFKGAIGGLVTVFHGLMLSFKIVWTLLSMGFKNLMDVGGAFGKVMYAVLHGDFSGAATAAKAGMKALQTNASEAFDKIAKDASDTRDKIYNLFAAPTATTAKVGGEHSDGKDEKDKKAPSRIGDWKEELTMQLEADQNYFKDSLKDEIQFWNSKLELTKKGSKERQAVLQELFALHKKEAQDALQNDIADLKAQSDAMQAGGVERIRIAGEIAAKIGEKYGTESKEYKTALIDMSKSAQEHQKQLDKLEDMRIERIKQHSLSELELDRERIKSQQAMGEISNMQSLQALQKLAEDEYQIELKSEQDKADLIRNDEVAKQAAYDKLAAMAEKHRLDMNKITSQMAIEQKAQWDKIFEPISSAFEKTVDGIIQGTMTMKQGLSNLFKSIALEFTNMGVKMLVQWVSNEARKTFATTAGVSARTAAETAGAAQSASVGGMASIKSIMNSAYEVMASVYKSLAGIPVVGPVLAPIAAAGAFATVAGYAGSVMSAEGGYDIPAGINPLTQLHEKEMVLPKAQAEAVRSMADGGGSGGAIHLHVNAIDAKSVERLFKDNGHHLAAALKQQVRNFNTAR